MQIKPDEDFYLTYHNSELNHIDYKGYLPGQYLTSGSIQFYYEHLRQTYKEPEYILLDPSQVQLILEPYQDFEDLVDWFSDKFYNSEYIFIPINDAQQFDVPGAGSHWVLLIFEKKNRKFIYYDSTQGFVQKAGKVAQMLTAITFRDKSIIKKEKINIQINSSTPKQENGFDCGIFVLTFSEFILNWIEKNKYSDTIQNIELMKSHTNQSVVSKKRQQIHQFILKLYQEKLDQNREQKRNSQNLQQKQEQQIEDQNQQNQETNGKDTNSSKKGKNGKTSIKQLKEMLNQQ
ncbi:hypothetical protein PPERSA_02552 [Pseudocohnilembus persalinus]|uniref:Ubiquitin-like protease family profile domain-containing protein n=1 Tax=Pseudocohnilembus persalinus TaxID=266149 RepID=A0A0V0R5R0_PSEPJ|nr:hypothetical protein PPERSA_02552 [Pseudocohnilembus persalinus]|eukprot:KRX09680.1 hypothetical protein PPERSA_02552 [Pseudocohnilembus persalinus]